MELVLKRVKRVSSCLDVCFCSANRTLYLLLILIVVFLIAGCSNEKNKVIEYGDYKCPYCKKVETDIMPKLQKDYIDKDKADYKFVNMAFLGKDAIKGSRADHAVQNIAPNHYLEFQKLIFSKQPNHENEWLTEQLIDRQIDKLNISNKKAKKIKEAPTLYVNGKKLKDPYNYKEYKKYLK
ncbi:DsbA family protein [Hathewaya histolytica]|uniref:DsbA family protein n=1 Tax=Hathewaya histolytica TaxID=1498 RepID=UPI003B6732A9